MGGDTQDWVKRMGVLIWDGLHRTECSYMPREPRTGRKQGSETAGVSRDGFPEVHLLSSAGWERVWFAPSGLLMRSEREGRAVLGVLSNPVWKYLNYCY